MLLFSAYLRKITKMLIYENISSVLQIRVFRMAGDFSSECSKDHQGQGVGVLSL